MLALGSVLPWAEVSALFLSRTINGTEGDGKITLVLGLLSGLLFVVSGHSPAGTWLGTVVAAIGGAVAGYDLINLSSALSDIPPARMLSIGIGLYLCVGGAADSRRRRSRLRYDFFASGTAR